MAGLDIATWKPYKYISVYDVRRDRVIITDIETPSYSAVALSIILRLGWMESIDWVLYHVLVESVV